MTTDVSMRPRSGRASATGREILIEDGVYVLPEARARDSRRAGKNSQHGVGRYEHTLAQRTQLSHRNAIPRDDEGFSPVQVAHDAPTVVPEFALCDPSSHHYVV